MTLHFSVFLIKINAALVSIKDFQKQSYRPKIQILMMITTLIPSTHL